jgi:hypothetical protein
MYERSIYFSRNPDQALTAQESDELNNIAYMNIWQGGAGVINARNQLDLELEDVPDFYRLANQGSIPKTIYTNTSVEERVAVYNSEGKLIYTGTEKAFYAERNNTPIGIYAVKNLVTNVSKKISVIH